MVTLRHLFSPFLAILSSFVYTQKESDFGAFSPAPLGAHIRVLSDKHPSCYLSSTKVWTQIYCFYNTLVSFYLIFLHFNPKSCSEGIVGHIRICIVSLEISFTYRINLVNLQYSINYQGINLHFSTSSPHKCVFQISKRLVIFVIL